MNFESKFDLGQRVFRVGRKKRTESATCPKCEGTGRLMAQAADGPIQVRCPGDKCGGRGSWIVTRYDEYEVYGEARIGRIELRVQESADDFYPAFEENYMLDVTGIGSGTVYPLRDGEWSHTHLFATEHEAEAFCAAENPKLRSEAEAVA